MLTKKKVIPDQEKWLVLPQNGLAQLISNQGDPRNYIKLNNRESHILALLVNLMCYLSLAPGYKYFYRDMWISQLMQGSFRAMIVD